MKTYFSLISLFLFFACHGPSNGKKQDLFDQPLVDELEQMVKIDQLAASNAFPPNEYKYLSQDEWETKKDSIYRSNKLRLEEILESHGYPGFDRVGKNGEHNFWLLVQHSDFDLNFQERVLVLLQTQVEKKNADASNFALLTDRVRINQGKKQLYGTQVTYIQETGQAIPLLTEDSLSVDARRKRVGLFPIKEYLNAMTESHFEMNKEYFLKKGITEPNFHVID